MIITVSQREDRAGFGGQSMTSTFACTSICSWNANSCEWYCCKWTVPSGWSSHTGGTILFFKMCFSLYQRLSSVLYYDGAFQLLPERFSPDVIIWLLSQTTTVHRGCYNAVPMVCKIKVANNDASVEINAHLLVANVPDIATFSISCARSFPFLPTFPFPVACV